MLWNQLSAVLQEQQILSCHNRAEAVQLSLTHACPHEKQTAMFYVAHIGVKLVPFLANGYATNDPSSMSSTPWGKSELLLHTLGGGCVQLVMYSESPHDYCALVGVLPVESLTDYL